MAFPETSLLADFVGPPENPLSDDGRWAAYIRPPLQRGGSGSAHGTVEYAVNGSYWAQQSYSGGIIEAWGCAPVAGLGAALESWRILLLRDDPNGMVGYSSGYGGGIGENYFFRRLSGGGAFTTLGEVGGGGPNPGLGIRITPTAVEQWAEQTPGTWTLIQSFADTTYRGGNWYIAIETEEQGSVTSVGWSCFGGGVPVRSQFFRWLYN